MNERILELAKKAGLKFSSETAMSPVELKFAELIIEDCICVVDSAVHHRLPASSYVDVIREHFAVE
jgi:hypothetical protein